MYAANLPSPSQPRPIYSVEDKLLLLIQFSLFEEAIQYIKSRSDAQNIAEMSTWYSHSSSPDTKFRSLDVLCKKPSAPFSLLLLFTTILKPDHSVFIDDGNCGESPSNLPLNSLATHCNDVTLVKLLISMNTNFSTLEQSQLAFGEGNCVMDFVEKNSTRSNYQLIRNVVQARMNGEEDITDIKPPKAKKAKKETTISSKGKKITIRIQEPNNSIEPTFLQIKSKTAMGKILTTFCSAKSYDAATSQLSFDGDVVAATDTPESLDMEDMDKLDLVVSK